MLGAVSVRLSCMDGISFSNVCQSSLSSHEKVQLPQGRNGRGQCSAPAACHTLGFGCFRGILQLPGAFSLGWVYFKHLIPVGQSGASEVVIFCIKVACTDI